MFKLFPISFGLKIGPLVVLTATLFDLDDEAENVSNTSGSYGFAPDERVDDLSPNLEDNDGTTDDSTHRGRRDRYGFGPA